MNKASLMLDDRVFLGEGLFETIRVAQQKPCYSPLHWQRLSLAARRVGIAFALSFDAWHMQLLQVIKEASLDEGAIKVLLCGGKAPRGLEVYGESPTLIVDTFHYAREQRCVRLVSAPWLRDANNPIYQLKSVNYLESILAKRQAIAMGADDALFFNLQHQVMETTVANVFMVKEHEIFTPSLEQGILPGIIRSRILALCKHAGIACHEKILTQDSLKTADAIFVTNALHGIRLVQSIDGQVLSTEHAKVTLLQQLLCRDEQLYSLSIK